MGLIFNQMALSIYGMTQRFILTILLFCATSTSIVEGALLGKRKKENLDIIQQDELALQLLKTAEKDETAGRKKSAAKKYMEVFKRYSNSFYSPEALYRSAKIRSGQHKWKKAYETFNTVVVFYPHYEKFNAILQEQFDIANTMATKKTSRFFGVIPFYNYDSSVKYFEILIANAPYSDFAPLSLFQVALIHKKRGHEIRAIDAFDRLVNNYPKSMLTPDAYRELANTFSSLVEGPKYDQGATREAIANYKDYLILFPDDNLVEAGEKGLQEMEDTFAKSKLEMGEFYYKKRKNIEAARVFFNEAITVAPNSNSAQNARDYLAVMPEPPVAGEGVAVAAAANQDDSSKRGLIRRMQFWRRSQDGETQTPLEEGSTIEVASVEPPQTGEPAENSAESETDPVEEETGRGVLNRMVFWRKDRKKESPVSEE